MCSTGNLGAVYHAVAVNMQKMCITIMLGEGYNALEANVHN